MAQWQECSRITNVTQGRYVGSRLALRVSLPPKIQHLKIPIQHDRRRAVNPAMADVASSVIF